MNKQNIILLISSYFFYAIWDWRFLILLLFSTLLDYLSGIMISESKCTKKKKIWFYLSVFINLGFLCFFKYFNFFIDSAAHLFSIFGIQINRWSLNIILPVGISFYTFHGLSYVIDIYKNKIQEERNFIQYALFVTYFPLLVAGPIERATHLLPQLKKQRNFNYAQSVDGMRQILWGLVKKIVIADQCALYANEIFNNSVSYNGSTLIIGGVFFAFQIYCDFSGYSDIALGVSKLFGITLLKNFSYPYFSRDIAEFWRRWHISLSSWFRDYVYIPLGGSKKSLFYTIRNIFVIFILSGFWHGANWTFIFWGVINALFFIPILLLNKNRSNIDIVAKDRVIPNIQELILMTITFLTTVLAWIIFRSENMQQALNIYSKIFSSSILIAPYIKGGSAAFPLLILLLIFIIIEWIGRRNEYAIAKLSFYNFTAFRYLFYFILIFSLFCFGGKDQQFIYFQF